MFQAAKPRDLTDRFRQYASHTQDKLVAAHFRDGVFCALWRLPEPEERPEGGKALYWTWVAECGDGEYPWKSRTRSRVHYWQRREFDMRRAETDLTAVFSRCLDETEKRVKRRKRRKRRKGKRN